MVRVGCHCLISGCSGLGLQLCGTHHSVTGAIMPSCTGGSLLPVDSFTVICLTSDLLFLTHLLPIVCALLRPRMCMLVAHLPIKSFSKPPTRLDNMHACCASSWWPHCKQQYALQQPHNPVAAVTPSDRCCAHQISGVLCMVLCVCVCDSQ